MPTYFLSHGGGPWPWMNGAYRDAYKQLEASLQNLPAELPTPPRAILMISAHWVTGELRVMTNPKPSMIYDYGGFPEHTYHIVYGAPGAPDLAARVANLLKSAGLNCASDPERGFDHGMYAPLAVSFPQANVPVVQLSIQKNFGTEFHLDVGRALSALRDEGVLIIGSGLSYHNLRAFDPRAAAPSAAFDLWLRESLVGPVGQARNVRLEQWEHAPAARLCHPREDHLIPLMVAVGAAEDDAGSACYHEDDFMGGISVSSFRFG